MKRQRSTERKRLLDLSNRIVEVVSGIILMSLVPGIMAGTARLFQGKLLVDLLCRVSVVLPVPGMLRVGFVLMCERKQMRLQKAGAADNPCVD